MSLFAERFLDEAPELPENIRLGTSSWNYEGWKDLVYFENYSSGSDFTRRSLGEYASYRLFRTVGIDASFYNPLGHETLLNYAALVPETFQWISKVWERITIPVYAKHPRYGELAGKENPDFLNASLFKDSVLSQVRAEEVIKRTGPFVFQFQKMPSYLVSAFPERLDKFFSELPHDFRYAVEIRNRELLSVDYFSSLNNHKVTHCFNHWTSMPRLLEQMKAAAQAGGLEADFYVSRLLTPLGVSYQQAVERFKPYTEIQERQADLRDDLKKLFRRSIDRNVTCYVIVNNRLEGCSPQTILEVAQDEGWGNTFDLNSYGI